MLAFRGTGNRIGRYGARAADYLARCGLRCSLLGGRQDKTQRRGDPKTRSSKGPGCWGSSRVDRVLVTENWLLILDVLLGDRLIGRFQGGWDQRGLVSWVFLSLSDGHDTEEPRGHGRPQGRASWREAPNFGGSQDVDWLACANPWYGLTNGCIYFHRE